MKKKSLFEVAKVLRSKNAGPFEVTFDIMFDDRGVYETVRDSRLLNRKLICGLYGMEPEQVSHVVYFDPALAIKVTMARPISSGTVGDTDVYGAQQHAPLMSILVPVKS